jgi:uncharacterized protein involved in exopolysaccharide biosynthesis
MTTSNGYAGPPADRREISILEFWLALLDEWRLVLSIVALSAGLSIVVALVLTPVYRAEVTVVEATQGGAVGPTAAMLGQVGGLASLAGIDLGALRGDSGKNRAILNSRMIIAELIKRNELLPILFPDEWNEKTNSWISVDDEAPTLWRGVQYFSEEVLTVSEDPTEGVIRVVVEWTDPDLAAAWANGVIALANDIIRRNDLSEAERNVEYLNEEIGKTSVVELQQILYRLIQTEMQTMMLANARLEYAFPVVDPAVPPEIRSFPKRTLIAVGGTMLGGFVAMFVVLIRLTLRKSKLQQPATV